MELYGGGSSPNGPVPAAKECSSQHIACEMLVRFQNWNDKHIAHILLQGLVQRVDVNRCVINQHLRNLRILLFVAQVARMLGVSTTSERSEHLDLANKKERSFQKKAN